MKYYSELSRLEEKLIELENISGLVNVIACGFENSADLKNVQRSVYLLEDKMNEINQSLTQNFQQLWDAVRDDSLDKSDNIEYDFDSIDSVVKTWAKT